MINYKGTPILGPDSSIKNTSEFFAIAGTVLFWLLFLIFSFVIKPRPKKPEYKEVQIVLSSTPVVQPVEESPAPAEQAASDSAASEMVETPATEVPVVEAPAVEKPVETPAPASVPVKETKPAPVKETKPAAKPVEKKTEPSKTQTQTPKPSEPVKYAVDPMEAFAQQTKQQPKKDFDWSQFDDEEPAEATATNQVKTVQSNVPAFSGSAGTAASDTEQKVTSTSANNSKSQKASATTSNALEGIKNSIFKGTAANGIQSESTVKTKASGTGKVEMEMSNGRSRALIKPASPVINLSAQAAATIDASITVSISFKVNEKGNVSGVTITPASALSNIVRQEIIGQLLEWLFEPADYSANATFEYKIIKR